jgi:hypothetical protein
MSSFESNKVFENVLIEANSLSSSSKAENIVREDY